MKQLIYIGVLFVLLAGVIGCGDNSDFSNLHILTDDEIAEMHRQDSLDSVKRAQINADLILEYTVPITILANGYDGTNLYIDTVKIAEKFGITTAQLRKGIYNMRSAEWGTYDDDTNVPKLTGFCIEGSSHNDNMTAYNTNACWGHWWDKDGNTTTWGDNARVFTEYDVNGGFFHVGQMPGLLEEGKSIKFIEGLKYQDIRIAIVVTAIPEKQGEVTAQIVNTQELNLKVTPNNEYVTTPLNFDLAKTLSDLGISTITDAKFVALNADGSFAQEYSAAPNGFYYDKEGYAGSWGDNASVFVTHPYSADSEDAPEDEVAVGQMANAMAVGDVITVKFGILANNKIEMLSITVEIVDYQDPETAPEGTPYEETINLTIEKTWSSGGFNESFDVREKLRDAFKMTTYQLYTAKLDKTLKMYLGEETTEDPSYTANAPGYWMDAIGNVANWGTGSDAVWVELQMNETTINLAVGNNPDNCDPSGVVIPVKLIVTCADNAGKVTINLTIKLTTFVDSETPPTGTPTDTQKDITFTKPYTSDYAQESADVRELLKDAFKMTTYQIYQALQSGDLKVYIGEETSEAPSYTGGAAGEYWIDANGAPCEYADGVLYVGFYTDGSDYMEIGAGNHPENCSKEGQTVTTKIIVTCNGVKATFNVTVTITAAAE